ncbi:MAG: DNA polymerase III subunit delta' [Bacillota bacterium]|nr:DNA polymerase III subunit delta' [Bacillota bacterium]MDW7684712.1 DNA polymerase III subunit delta' [Bacillota bacterium]
MNWNGLYGRPQLINILQSAISEGKTAHACLLYGPKGIGKKTVARAYATALNCQNPSLGTCGECVSCRKAASGAHPDIHWIVPDGKSIKIEQIRNVKKSAFLRPHEGRFQIFILDGADLLTKEAANSLLKVLEEPPPASIFILLAENPSSLLPTVASRCLLFALPRLDRQSMKSILSDAGLASSAEETVRVLDLAEGIPGRALALAGRSDWHSSFLEGKRLLASLYKGDAPDAHATRLAEKENLEDELDMILFVLRDLLMMQTARSQELITCAGEAELLRELLDKWPATATVQAIEAILKLQRDMRSPVNVRLALERALRRLKEVLTDADSCGYTL